MGRFPILTDENTAKGIAKALVDRGWDVARGVHTVAQGTHDDVGEVVEAIEALAQEKAPFAYPIVYLRPRK